ncbi:MAG: zinc ribbon domain-containing protein [Chloroflexi bacterium]|nr:zinc ribbon domain-containing protein [Chloroflexota bacterium]
MKRTTLLLLLLLLLPTPFAQAQTAVTLQSLEVELWPDFDREAVLVLLTGTLPANTILPVTITIPLPENADFNVVARITPEDVMTDQGVEPQLSANQVTFDMPDGRFRVEYYQPYSANDSQRSFTFSWQSQIDVEQMSVTVQQPIAATDLTIIPNPATMSEGEDGLTYHVLPNQVISANDNYTVEVNYTMTSPQLTVSFSTPDTTNNDSPVLDAESAEDEESGGIDWPLLLFILGGLILGGTAVAYLINRQSAASRPAKPKPRRPQAAAKGKAKFCRQCGQPLQPTDKFCRECGTAVKT